MLDWIVLYTILLVTVMKTIQDSLEKDEILVHVYLDVIKRRSLTLLRDYRPYLKSFYTVQTYTNMFV